jgi:pSer/pThr/pTyr-binding forkhead associated (FHA) protein
MSDQCQNQPDRLGVKNLPAAGEPMDVTLQMKWGSLLGKKIRVPVGQPVKVGRSSQCDISVVYDHYMSRTHFSLGWEGTTCWICDLNSRHGTFLNGRKVQKAPLGEGDVIRAGLTILVVRRHRDDSDEPVGICEGERSVIDSNGLANFEPMIVDAERLDIAARARQRH